MFLQIGSIVLSAIHGIVPLMTKDLITQIGLPQFIITVCVIAIVILGLVTGFAFYMYPSIRTSKSVQQYFDKTTLRLAGILVVTTIISQVLYFCLVHQCSHSTLPIIIAVLASAPIFTLMFSKLWWNNKNTITHMTIVGIVMIVLGVVLLQWSLT